MGGSRVPSQSPFLWSARIFPARQRHGGHEEGCGDEGGHEEVRHEEGCDEGCDEGEEGEQRDEESSHEGTSHAEGHEEVQGVRVGMRAEQWGRFLKSALPTTHFGLLLWIHSAGCGQCFFSRRGLYGRSRQLECI